MLFIVKFISTQTFHPRKKVIEIQAIKNTTSLNSRRFRQSEKKTQTCTLVPQESNLNLIAVRDLQPGNKTIARFISGGRD